MFSRPPEKLYLLCANCQAHSTVCAEIQGPPEAEQFGMPPTVQGSHLFGPGHQLCGASVSGEPGSTRCTPCLFPRQLECHLVTLCVYMHRQVKPIASICDTKRVILGLIATSTHKVYHLLSCIVAFVLYIMISSTLLLTNVRARLMQCSIWFG